MVVVDDDVAILLVDDCENFVVWSFLLSLLGLLLLVVLCMVSYATNKCSALIESGFIYSCSKMRFIVRRSFDDITGRISICKCDDGIRGGDFRTGMCASASQ